MNNSAPAGATGSVAEIFSSLQGEGLYAGQQQIFLRLGGCPWRCRYCDTPLALDAAGHEVLTDEETARRVLALGVGPDTPRTVSVTGGEPLAQTEFLMAVLPRLKAGGLVVHLETSGTLPSALRAVVDLCDVVAMDIKLPQDIGRVFWDEHAAFLAVAGAKAFVKLVLTADTVWGEFERAVLLCEGAAAPPPLVLQPVTPIEPLERRLPGGAAGPSAVPLAGGAAGQRIVPPSRERLTAFYDRAAQHLPVVKIVPQMHPVWGVR